MLSTYSNQLTCSSRRFVLTLITLLALVAMLVYVSPPVRAMESDPVVSADSLPLGESHGVIELNGAKAGIISGN